MLAEPNGALVGKANNKDGYLKVDQVEKLLDAEIKKRESAIKERLEDAKSKAKSGDNQTAIQEYRAVLEQKCLFPGKAKDAAKALKKLGVTDVAEVFDAPVMDAEARRKDRADSARRPARRKRCQVHGCRAALFPGAQDGSRRSDAPTLPRRTVSPSHWRMGQGPQTFNTILAMHADPLSRAVALHGLGKITIHEGEFKKGFALMEQSVGRLSPCAGVPQSVRVLELRGRCGENRLLRARRRSRSIRPIDTTWSLPRRSWPATGTATKL